MVEAIDFPLLTNSFRGANAILVTVDGETNEFCWQNKINLGKQCNAMQYNNNNKKDPCFCLSKLLSRPYLILHWLLKYTLQQGLAMDMALVVKRNGDHILCLSILLSSSFFLTPATFPFFTSENAEPQAVFMYIHSCQDLRRKLNQYVIKLCSCRRKRAFSRPIHQRQSRWTQSPLHGYRQVLAVNSTTSSSTRRWNREKIIRWC